MHFHTQNYMQGWPTFLQVPFTALSHKFLNSFLIKKKEEMKVAFMKLKQVHIDFLLPYERKLK